MTMRQVRSPGERLFVDCAGMAVAVTIDGVSREAQIFVASMGVSGLAYAEAMLTQMIDDWCASRVRCFQTTRWAPPVFLPPTASTDLWLFNLEESAPFVPMVQAALYQLSPQGKCGEYELPESASIIARGNRENDRGIVHRTPTLLANRFVHLEIRVDAKDWCACGAANGIAPEVLFFIELEPELLHQFHPDSKEHAFPSPRSREFASNIFKNRNGLDAEVERALFRGMVGGAAAVEFIAFPRTPRA